MEKLKINLKAHIKKLSDEIGARNYIYYDELNEAADYIAGEFGRSGYRASFQNYNAKNKLFKNVIAVKEGTKKREEIIVVGAHYDTMLTSPGANDNTSGVSALLELARLAFGMQTERTIKFVAFTNEEPPFFFTKDMGSRVYAGAASERGEDIRAMICLETIGYYSDERNSQNYPMPFGLFYPDRANFIGAVGNFKSLRLLKILKKAFKKNSTFNIITAAMPTLVTGVNFSDHDSFWRQGYKACMVTDTAFYRYRYYHTSEDTYEKLDYEKLSLVVEGLHHALLKLSKTRLI